MPRAKDRLRKRKLEALKPQEDNSPILFLSNINAFNFLSNFALVTLTLFGITFPHSEACYQYVKILLALHALEYHPCGPPLLQSCLHQISWPNCPQPNISARDSRNRLAIAIQI